MSHIEQPAASSPAPVVHHDDGALPCADQEGGPDLATCTDPGTPTTYRPDVFYGWGQALTFIRAHFVPEDTPVRPHAGRIVGDGLCGFPGLVDEDGSVAGQMVKHCRTCQQIKDGAICRRCKGRQAIVVRDELAPGVGNAHEVVCPACLGEGKPTQRPTYRP